MMKGEVPAGWKYSEELDGPGPDPSTPEYIEDEGR